MLQILIHTLLHLYRVRLVQTERLHDSQSGFAAGGQLIQGSVAVGH